MGNKLSVPNKVVRLSFTVKAFGRNIPRLNVQMTFAAYQQEV